MNWIVTHLPHMNAEDFIVETFVSSKQAQDRYLYLTDELGAPSASLLVEDQTSLECELVAALMRCHGCLQGVHGANYIH